MDRVGAKPLQGLREREKCLRERKKDLKGGKQGDKGIQESLRGREMAWEANRMISKIMTSALKGKHMV